MSCCIHKYQRRQRVAAAATALSAQLRAATGNSDARGGRRTSGGGGRPRPAAAASEGNGGGYLKNGMASMANQIKVPCLAAASNLVLGTLCMIHHENLVAIAVRHHNPIDVYAHSTKSTIM